MTCVSTDFLYDYFLSGAEMNTLSWDLNTRARDPASEYHNCHQDRLNGHFAHSG